MTSIDSLFLVSKLHCDPESIHSIDVIDSTNTEAKRLAVTGAQEGTLVIASSQTSGRGRMGRSFFSPEDTGLYMSLLLRPELSPDKLLNITTLAAVCVCKALESLFPVSASIKWVNDVYVGGKKVCGILTEGAFKPDGSTDYAVLGIGVNISAPASGFPNDIKTVAGSVSTRYGDEHIREELCVQIVTAFMLSLPYISQAPHLEEYRRRSYLIGKDITVFRPGAESYSACVVGVSDSFGLIVQLENGSVTALSSGEVSVRSAEAAPPDLSSQK